jgi:hypothetical protein
MRCAEAQLIIPLRVYLASTLAKTKTPRNASAAKWLPVLLKGSQPCVWLCHGETSQARTRQGFEISLMQSASPKSWNQCLMRAISIGGASDCLFSSSWRPISPTMTSSRYLRHWLSSQSMVWFWPTPPFNDRAYSRMQSTRQAGCPVVLWRNNRSTACGLPMRTWAGACRSFPSAVLWQQTMHRPDWRWAHRWFRFIRV